MRTRVVAAVLSAGILGAACSSSSPPGPGPSSSPTASPASSTPTPSPPGSNTPGPVVSMRSGTATLKLTGGLSAKLALPIERSADPVWQPATGTIALPYLTRDANALILKGTLSAKRAKTSQALTMSFVVQGKRGATALLSSRGECTVTVTSAKATHVAGRFSCSRLFPLGRHHERVSASGTFQASR